LERPTPTQIRKLIGVANYQFGRNVGEALFTKETRIECSRRTGRIRHIYTGKRFIATLRPKDGYLALSLHGAELLLSKLKEPPNIVVVQTDVSDFIKTGGDVFAKHIVQADENLRPAEEAIVTDENGGLLAVGRAELSGIDMKFFKRGVAVKVRRGIDEQTKGHTSFTEESP
jgi:7-cyano-7-deazaguanine tRNA-ribosyltransferase